MLGKNVHDFTAVYVHISRPFLRLAYQYLLKKLEGFDKRK